MEFNANRFGLSCAITSAFLWVICSLLVMVFPAMMLALSGDMLHFELFDMGWHLTLMGFFKGLGGWFFIVGFAGWLLAAIYNYLQ